MGNEQMQTDQVSCIKTIMMMTIDDSDDDDDDDVITRSTPT